MESEGREKRRDFRWETPVPARLVRIEGAPGKVEGRTLNLSAGGCLIAVTRGDPEPFEPGSLCETDLILPDGKVFLIVRVLRKTLDQAGRVCLALQFISVDKGDQDRIARYVLHSEVREKRIRDGEETGPGGGDIPK